MWLWWCDTNQTLCHAMQGDGQENHHDPMPTPPIRGLRQSSTFHEAEASRFGVVRLCLPSKSLNRIWSINNEICINKTIMNGRGHGGGGWKGGCGGGEMKAKTTHQNASNVIKTTTTEKYDVGDDRCRWFRIGIRIRIARPTTEDGGGQATAIRVPAHGVRRERTAKGIPHSEETGCTGSNSFSSIWPLGSRCGRREETVGRLHKRRQMMMSKGKAVAG